MDAFEATVLAMKWLDRPVTETASSRQLAKDVPSLDHLVGLLLKKLDKKQLLLFIDALEPNHYGLGMVAKRMLRDLRDDHVRDHLGTHKRKGAPP
jgi:hypothetical protein